MRHPILSVSSLVGAGVAIWVIALYPAYVRAQETGSFETFTNYQAYIAGGPTVSAWYGDRVALVIDGEDSPQDRDAEAMTKIVETFDDIFDAFDSVTGRSPALNAPLRGKIRIEVSSSVGGGLANHGSLGVAIGDGFFEGLYNRVRSGTDTYDQVFFYEIARNYWMPDMNPRIDYHTSAGLSDYGWWTVGFNNAMSIFLPEVIDTVDDMYYFGSGGETFSQGMEANLNTYIAGEGLYNWDNSWNVPLMPWSQSTSLNDLMTGLLVRLHRDHGGSDFIQRLYEEIPMLEPLENMSDWQGARNNFYVAASLAADQDLADFFTDELRWELTVEAPLFVPTLLGDLNGDELITIADWHVFRQNVGEDLSELSREEAYLHGDMDFDGDNDIHDFAVFRGVFADAANNLQAVSAIPEPGSLALLVVTAVVVSVSGRSRRS